MAGQKKKNETTVSGVVLEQIDPTAPTLDQLAAETAARIAAVATRVEIDGLPAQNAADAAAKSKSEKIAADLASGKIVSKPIATSQKPENEISTSFLAAGVAQSEIDSSVEKIVEAFDLIKTAEFGQVSGNLIIGRNLIEISSKIKHGSWTPWFSQQKKFEFSLRWAQICMSYAEKFDEAVKTGKKFKDDKGAEVGVNQLRPHEQMVAFGLQKEKKPVMPLSIEEKKAKKLAAAKKLVEQLEAPEDQVVAKFSPENSKLIRDTLATVTGDVMIRLSTERMLIEIGDTVVKIDAV